ncbi:hypothetical protein LPB140_02355 [Sphingorhabdus lutea]|uniref:Uncharacterized protein n=1 Tax=Sphingorhabdus lutea TaxID=1913578 RepID=A0A1L3J9R2_9SPHN|nr:hypothetical protein [Sphingorhabdus lutea]APG61859.1 hypothetical protein LPB140_02355 [Sphingorhabdus lutea]
MGFTKSGLRGVILSISLIIGASITASSATAQFGILKDVAKKVAAPKVAKIIPQKQPVSTNIADAIYGVPEYDRFVPDIAQKSLTSLPRDEKGGFILAAGYYSFNAQSYCLHAGTHGPGGGDGYLYAPLKGTAQRAVQSILENSVAHPEIEQKEIQTLLWAIVARAKFENLSTRTKFVASQLLTPQEIAALNRDALGMLTDPAFAKITGGLPPFARQVLRAEADLRAMLSSSSSSYEELERIAVLTGAVERGEGSIDTPATRWSLHPDGYYIRYDPFGYSKTKVEIWVEVNSPAIGKTYNPAVHIAVPGNTSRQRLAQSAREYGK